MTTTTTTTTPPGACPGWCTLVPGHDWDSIDAGTGRESRGHGGPDFGPHLGAGADEFSDLPGVLAYEVLLHTEYANLTPRELLDLAVHAIEASRWLGAHQ